MPPDPEITIPGQHWRHDAANPNVQLRGPWYPYFPSLYSSFGYCSWGLPEITGLRSDLDSCDVLPGCWKEIAGQWEFEPEDSAEYPGRVRWVYGTWDGIATWWLLPRYRMAVREFTWTGTDTATVRLTGSPHPLAVGDHCRLLLSRRTASSTAWNEWNVRVIEVADDESGDRRVLTLAGILIPTAHTWPVSVASSYYNQLTTRTSDTEGIITFGEDHGIEEGDLVDVRWSSNWSSSRRFGMTAVATTETEVTLSGGWGDALPAAGTRYLVAGVPGGTQYLAVRAGSDGPGAPMKRGEIAAQLSGATQIDFGDSHGFTTADRVKSGTTVYTITATSAETITITPARSGAVGTAVDFALLPLPRRGTTYGPYSSTLYRTPLRYTPPDIEEPTAGELVTADGQPWGVLHATELPATILTTIETYTWGTDLDRYYVWPELAAADPAAGDMLRVLVDYQDAHNYLAVEVAVLEHPYDEEDDGLYRRVRIIRRAEGVETQLSRVRIDTITTALALPSVRLDPAWAAEDAAVLSIEGLALGAPVVPANTRVVGIALLAGDIRLRGVHGGTLQPLVTLTTRTSDTEGVIAFPEGVDCSGLHFNGYYDGWYESNPDLPGETTGHAIGSPVFDEDDRTISFTTGGVLPDEGTRGRWRNLYIYDAIGVLRATWSETHDQVYPAGVIVTVSDFALFAGEYALTWGRFAGTGFVHYTSGQPANRYYVWSDSGGYDWPGYSVAEQPDDTRQISVRIAAPPSVAGKLTTRTSNTEGAITFTVMHRLREGDLVRVNWGSSSWRQDMTVDSVAGDVVTVSGGSGSNLPPENTAITAVGNTSHCDTIFVGLNVPSPDESPLYGPHAVGDGASNPQQLALCRRVTADTVDWREGPLREGGPFDNLTLDRDDIYAPARLKFTWDPAEDGPITVAARSGPDAEGVWTATLQFPARADQWTVPDVGESLTLFFAPLESPYSGSYAGEVTAVDDEANTITWTVDLDGQTADYIRTGILTTRTSDTEGTITLDDDHDIGIGETPVRVAGGGNIRTGMTVTGAVGLAVTVSGGTGSVLPTQGSAVTVYVTRDREIPPVDSPVSNTLTWYASTWRHFAPEFEITASLVDSVAL